MNNQANDVRPLLIMCRGLPASGKTTFSKKWVEEDPEHRMRVSRDDIRRMLGPYWVPSREKLVTAIEKASITHALFQKYNVIIDATNLKISTRSMFYDLAKFHKSDFEVKDFTKVSLETCLERDSKREGDSRVGAKVITDMYETIKNNIIPEQVKECLDAGIPDYRICELLKIHNKRLKKIMSDNNFNTK